MTTVAADAAGAAALFALDPAAIGGVQLRGPAGELRARWLDLVHRALPRGTPWRKIPCHASDDRLLGDLNVAATLRRGRPVLERGVLAEADHGVVLIAMAERLDNATAARLTAVLDAAEVVLARHGIEQHHPARFGVIALDESMSPDENVPGRLADRLALLVDLTRLDPRTPLELPPPTQFKAARRRLKDVAIDPEALEALCETALALGVHSLRHVMLAGRVARAAAALALRSRVEPADLELAARLVLTPRATRLPAAETGADDTAPAPEAERPASAMPEESRASPGDAAEPPLPAPTPPLPAAADAQDPGGSAQSSDLAERLTAAARAALPAGLLAALGANTVRAAPASSASRAGDLNRAGTRGRPCGVRRWRGHGRLHLAETLRAAAPWQKLRAAPNGRSPRLRLRLEDLREHRLKQRAATVTVFAVDASGSAALHRLAEAKGAVELLLADCYVRRDQVAVIGFRGRDAELLLPPTRSLVRAKRRLAGLPGGGGTPLARALLSARELARQARRRGETPTLVILSDGRANIDRSGKPGREQAHADALAAARMLAHERVAALFVDTSPQPSLLAQQIAGALAARYVPLPHVDAGSLSAAVRAAWG